MEHHFQVYKLFLNNFTFKILRQGDRPGAGTSQIMRSVVRLDLGQSVADAKVSEEAG